MDAIGFRPAPELLQMPVETLDLGEEADVEPVSVQHTDRVVRIGRRHEPVARVPDRLEVSWRDVPGDSGECEVFHCRPLWAISRALSGSYLSPSTYLIAESAVRVQATRTAVYRGRSQISAISPTPV